MSLNLKYYPKTFDDLWGNEETLEALQLTLKRKEDQPKAYLIVGPAGTGKTATAYLIRDALGCTQFGFTEKDAASDRGIDKMRELKRMSMFKPMEGGMTVIFLDEVHAITGIAQESLLKLLENPPDHIRFILATTDPQMLKTTLKRRCHTCHLVPLNNIEMRKFIFHIMRQEGIKPKTRRKLASKIIDVAEGSCGQALKYIDMTRDMESEESAVKVVESTNISENVVLEISGALLKGMGWKTLAEILSSFEGDGDSARRGVQGYLTKVLLNNRNASDHGRIAEMLEMFESHYQYGKNDFVLACYEACKSQED